MCYRKPGCDVELPRTDYGAFYSQYLDFDNMPLDSPALERAGIEHDAAASGEDADRWDGKEEEQEEEEDGGEERRDEWDEDEDEVACTYSNWMAMMGDYRPLLLRPRNMTWTCLHPPARSGEGDGQAMMMDVQVQFDLPPGAYATMALREIQRETPPATKARHIRFS